MSMSQRMKRSSGPDSAENMSPVGRSNSISSDIMSTSTSSTSIGAIHMPPPANPPPAYVAHREASELISAELERKVVLAQPALTLLNDFLDHVLYNILSTSHSVALGQLKAAVPVVLKPRLGKAALKVAEEELKEYMEEGEEQELQNTRTSGSVNQDFETDLVWKLARLRCMVYARMGDIEEEDEEEWVNREGLLDQIKASRHAGKDSIEVGPGAAIFLTAIVEYLAEQALYYAAQHAQKRHDSVRSIDSTSTSSGPSLTTKGSDIVLEGRDMNHIGRDSPLSRLWRSWKKDIRAVDTDSRPLSPEETQFSPLRPLHSRSTSASAVPSVAPIQEEQRTPSGTIQPSNLPPVSTPPTATDTGTVDSLNIGKSASRSGTRPLSLPAVPTYAVEDASAGESYLPSFKERSPLRPKWDRRSSSQPGSETTSPTMERDMDFGRSTSTPHLPVPHIHMQITVTPQPQPSSTDYISANPTTEGQPRGSYIRLNNNVGALANAIDNVQVGVHHVAARDEPASEEAKKSLAVPQRSSSSANPTMSASISGPQDFDMIHVPSGRFSPESHPKSEIVSGDRESPASPAKVQSENPIKSAERLEERPPGNYVPTPEPDEYYVVPHRQPHVPVAMNAPEPSRFRSDSPVSMASSRRSGRRLISPPPPGPPDVPASSQIISQPQPALRPQVEPDSPTNSRFSTTSSQLLGFSRDLSAQPRSAPEARMSDSTTIAVPSRDSSARKSAFISDRPPTAESSPTVRKRDRVRIRTDSQDLDSELQMRNEDNSKYFEPAVQNDERSRYTPTSPTVQPMFRPEDVGTPARRTQTQDLADFLRNTAPPGQEHARPRTARSAKRSMDATRAPQVLPINGSHTSVPASPTSTTRKHNLVGEARDARISARSSMRDLADYARSTGPTTRAQLPSAIGTAYTARNGSGWTAPTPGNPPPRQTSVPRRTTPSPKPVNRLKFQARDARTTRNAESSALIDFIRAGPPDEHGESINGRATTSMENRTVNGYSSRVPSMDTTTSSQTPLIRNGARPASAQGPQPSRHLQQAPVILPNGAAPQRSRRKVRDPYAIDYSDDELELMSARSKPRVEESLIDFLNNTAPTPAQAAQPVLVGPSSPRGRDPTPVMSNGTASARASSPHLTKAGTKLDKYRPTQVTHASHVERNRQERRRENGYSNGDHEEGAPAPSISTYRPGNSATKEERGLKKFFSLRGRLK